MVGTSRWERDPGAGRGEGSHRGGATQLPQRQAAEGHQPVQTIRPGNLDQHLRASTNICTIYT